MNLDEFFAKRMIWEEKSTDWFRVEQMKNWEKRKKEECSDGDGREEKQTWWAENPKAEAERRHLRRFGGKNNKSLERGKV